MPAAALGLPEDTEWTAAGSQTLEFTSTLPISSFPVKRVSTWGMLRDDQRASTAGRFKKVSNVKHSFEEHSLNAL